MNIARVQEPKFEILYELGAHAILDQYYREAISSFSASAERFYELAIMMLMNTGNHSEVLRETWKVVTKHSERQLGAFLFLWAYVLGSQPWTLPEKLVKQRNDAIHKGWIPTEKQAIQFGEDVRAGLVKNLNALQLFMGEKFIHEYLSVEGADAWAQARDQGRRVGNKSIFTLLSPTRLADLPERRSLSAYLDDHLRKSITRAPKA